MAENDKQQALHLAEAERVRITDRLSKSNQANEQLKSDLDGLKGQLYDTMEKAQQTELQKDEQIKDLENTLEDTKDLAANSEKQLNEQISVLNGDKDELNHEIHELKSHLTASEEQKEQQRRELGDAHRVIKEGEDAREIVRKENLE